MQTKSIFIIILSLFLTGCETIRPTWTECTSKVTAVEEGSRVTLRNLENGGNAQVRLNGVSALCNEKAGTVAIKIKIGLKLVRDMNQNEGVAELELPLLIAILDTQDKVESYESVSYKMTFPPTKSTIYPVITPKTQMQNSGRVIISLAPQVIKP
tara:strand:+ start:52 stop:516 length:465 start_codon:yes stop_codon:yes gene_type:complete